MDLQKPLRLTGIAAFSSLFLAMLILPLVMGKAAPGEVKYSNTTSHAIEVLDTLNTQQPLLMEQYNQALTAVQSNEQSICLQTVVVAQLKYKDTSASNLSDDEKRTELERLASVASDTRASCPGLFQ